MNLDHEHSTSLSIINIHNLPSYNQVLHALSARTAGTPLPVAQEVIIHRQVNMDFEPFRPVNAAPLSFFLPLTVPLSLPLATLTASWRSASPRWWPTAVPPPT